MTADMSMVITLGIVGCLAAMMLGPGLFSMVSDTAGVVGGVFGESIGVVGGLLSSENLQGLAKVPGIYFESMGKAVGAVGKGVGDAKESAFGRGNLVDWDGSNQKDKRRRSKEKRLKQAQRAALAEAEATAEAAEAAALIAIDQAFRDKWGGFTKDEVKSAGKGVGQGVVVAAVAWAAYSELRRRGLLGSSPSAHAQPSS